MLVSLHNTATGSGPGEHLMAQIATCVDEGTVDAVISLLRQVDQDPAVLEIFGSSTGSLFELLEQTPPDDRTAACLTAVSLLSGDPEQAIRWARWWVCIAVAESRRDFESRLWLSLAHWCCGDSRKAAWVLAELAGSDASVNQTRFALALAFLMLGQSDHLPSYQQAIATEHPALGELLDKLQCSIRCESDLIATGKQLAVEWCAGRLLGFVASSIFSPTVVAPAGSESVSHSLSVGERRTCL